MFTWLGPEILILSTAAKCVATTQRAATLNRLRCYRALRLVGTTPPRSRSKPELLGVVRQQITRCRDSQFLRVSEPRLAWSLALRYSEPCL
jgi:hypothetical protein